MYLYVKAVHIFMVMLFISGTFTFSTTRYVASEEGCLRRDELFRWIIKWDDVLMIPVLSLVWISGYTMAFAGEWQADAWLWAKLFFVAALTISHLAEGHALRRVLQGGRTGTSRIKAGTVVNMIAIAAIVALVVIKPF